MKKHAILAAAAAIAFGAFGAPPKAANDPADDRFAAHIAAARAYATNDAASAVWYVNFPYYTNAAHYAELDAVLAAKPPLNVLCAGSTNMCARYPRTFAAALDAYAATKPTLVRFVRQHGCFAGRAAAKLPAAEYAALYVERPIKHSHALRVFRKRIGEKLGSMIVPTLRRQGKAVTTGPDGRSPVKEYADRISAALDAPRFAGLQAILDDMGVDATLDLSYFPADAAVAAERDAVLAGTRALTDGIRTRISVCFGTQAYNAFVEAYNGGARD